MAEIAPELKLTVKLTPAEFRLVAQALSQSSDPEAVSLGDDLQRMRGQVTGQLARQSDRLVANVNNGAPKTRN